MPSEGRGKYWSEDKKQKKLNSSVTFKSQENGLWVRDAPLPTLSPQRTITAFAFMARTIIISTRDYCLINSNIYTAFNCQTYIHKAINSSCKRLMLCTHTGAERNTRSLFFFKAARATFVPTCSTPTPALTVSARRCAPLQLFDTRAPVSKTNGETKLERVPQGAGVMVSQWIHRACTGICCDPSVTKL